MFDGHFNALFCDGSVRLIPKMAPERLVRALITPSAEDYADLRVIGLTDPLRGPPLAVTGSTGNIAGQIRFDGTLLRGGTVTILASDGKTYTTAISPDGRYSFKNVPLGETRIAIETSSVRGKSGTNPENDPYVAIPELYTSLEFSPLKCEVVGGDLKLDFHLHN
jgi:prepilin-type processing-associated H-X9-DG protein